MEAISDFLSLRVSMRTKPRRCHLYVRVRSRNRGVGPGEDPDSQDGGGAVVSRPPLAGRAAGPRLAGSEALSGRTSETPATAMEPALAPTGRCPGRSACAR